MVVQHNIQAMNANRMLNITSNEQASSTEKLSSGYKINRAADDAAGLSISEKMRKQIRGLDQAANNAEDGISTVQTAEGALTEVHDMLQRMNELATQAANGTNSESDRASIQQEIDQLTTEIDRVAETTKFNETYLLKGNGKKATVKVNAHDAGIEGNLRGVGTGTATFTMTALKHGESITIGGRGYRIGTSLSNVTTEITDMAGKSGSVVTINGTAYTISAKTTSDGLTENFASAAYIAGLVSDGDTVIVGTRTYVAAKMRNQATADGGIGVNDNSIITATRAYQLISRELTKASSIGADPGSEATAKTKTPTPGAFKKGATQVAFTITEGEVATKQSLQLSLHVGSDADENNKISFNMETLTSAGLGVQGINVVDTTGAKGTYAIDAISDAIAKVSAQRSTLGAVQNRLEHTIKNLDNVVENTTAAESQIRDTDIAEEMVAHSKNNILAQAGQSMLAQANQSNQGALSLLG